MAWISTELGHSGWRDAVESLQKAANEEHLRGIARQVAQEEVVVSMQDWIMGDPITNGEISPELDFTGIVPEIQTWEDQDNVYVGIPTDNPASDQAHLMEYGDESQPPTPVLYQTYNASREDAQHSFEARLRDLIDGS